LNNSQILDAENVPFLFIQEDLSFSFFTCRFDAIHAAHIDHIATPFLQIGQCKCAQSDLTKYKKVFKLTNEGVLEFTF
jgi:hypothetical protein